MIFPTIRCAHPTCQCVISMGGALRVGTNLYCSLKCADGQGHCGHTGCSECRDMPHAHHHVPELHSKAS